MLNASWVVPDDGPELVLEAGAGRLEVVRAGGLVGFERTWEAEVGRVKGGCIRSSAEW